MENSGDRPKVFITGITGMIGSHLADHYRIQGSEVLGIARPSSTTRANTHVGVVPCDILEREELERILTAFRPDTVIHMAAQAFNGISWDMEETTLQTNIQGTRNVLRAVQRAVPEAKVLLACSSAEYGMVPNEDCPIREERLLRPVSPYGVSKLAGEALGYQYHKTFGLRVYLPRLFIHLGPGHPATTAVHSFARQLARIQKGYQAPSVKVGPLTTARDFIDVRDGVHAIATILEHGEPGEPYNICTGTAYTMRDVLERFIRISGLEVSIESESARFRPADEPILLGDNQKIKSLGWRQRFSLDQTLEGIYNDWLSRSLN